MRRVLVCGDRYWTDAETIRRVLESNLLPGDVVVHGAARGADSIGGRVALEHGFEVEAHPADWDKHGRAAGPIRNTEMLKSGLDLVLAFHNNLDQSKGTKHMVTIARKAGIPVEVFREGA